MITRKEYMNADKLTDGFYDGCNGSQAYIDATNKPE